MFDTDQWKYISLVSDHKRTYNFKFSRRNDATDFIIAVSDAASAVNNQFFGHTSRAKINMMMLRLKLCKIAKLRETKLSGLFARALYLTAAQTLPETSVSQMKTKFLLLE